MKKLKIIFIIFLVVVLVSCKKEEKSWETAKNGKTIEGYQNFIRSYPNSKHRREADKNISWLNAVNFTDNVVESDYIQIYKKYGILYKLSLENTNTINSKPKGEEKPDFFQLSYLTRLPILSYYDNRTFYYQKQILDGIIVGDFQVDQLTQLFDKNGGKLVFLLINKQLDTYDSLVDIIQPILTAGGQEIKLLINKKIESAIRQKFGKEYSIPVIIIDDMCFDYPPPNPKLIKKVMPEYPEKALQARITGKVTVKVGIDINGKVDKAMVVRGHSLLRNAALKAVKQWIFKPKEINGQAVPVHTYISLDFSLGR